MKGIVFTIGLVVLAIQLFGQTTWLNGAWKSTNGLARDIYTFDTTGKVKREFVGDLSYYKIHGSYTITNDTIKITYFEPTEEEKKIYFRGGTPQLADTIYIINNEKLVRKIKNLRIYLYNKSREVPVYNVDSLGVLNLTVRDFDDKILLMHRRNYVWTVIEVWTNPDSSYLTIKNYQLPLHSGTNEFWILVKQPLRDEYIKQFKVESKKSKVNVKNTKITDRIEFTAITYYTLSDTYGKVIINGISDTVDCSTLSTGKYYLDYDNQTKIIKKK